MMDQNRYAKDWNRYATEWDSQFGGRYAHLGDEWNDDSTPERRRDSYYFNIYLERFLTDRMTVMELGPGGGKWSVRIAPRVKRLIVVDVSEQMLERTKARCASLGIDNVDYCLSAGKDFQPITDDSIDFFFTHDVLVHVALEDIWPYTQEIARVLVPGGRGVCHYAVNTIPQAWTRIEQNNEWYRLGRNTLGQYYYYSPEALRQMYETCGLIIAEQHQEVWNYVCIFEKPMNSIVPTLERLLKDLLSEEANDNQYRSEVIAKLRFLPSQLEKSLTSLLDHAQNEPDYYKRVMYGAEIRRLWRGR
jgi:ubiquinone/menaquinone biosynthesis C-methylase UbiE